MSRRLVVIGAGGHGKVVADIALRCGYKDICFVDDHASGICMGLPIVGSTSDLHTYNDGNTEFIIGIGNNAVRRRIAETYDLNWTILIHPSAQIGSQVHIGRGTVVMANAVINACVSIGEHCIINSCAVVEHDNVLRNYVHISPRVALGGTVTVGEETHIGIGTVVKNNVEMCENCVVGAGAVVVKDICESGIYVGIPVRKIK